MALFDKILVKEMCVAGRSILTAGSTIKPGMLVNRPSAGYVNPHGVSDGFAQKLFAYEYPGKTINDDFIANDPVTIKLARPGDEVYAWLADAQTVAFGDPLSSNGDGCLKLDGAPTGCEVVGIALDSITASGDTRLLIEIV